MPETQTQTTIPGTEAQAAPDAAPPPAVATEPPAKPQKVKGRQQPVTNGRRSDDIVIPQKAFKQRIDREAAMIVKRRLGISIEEAEQLVRAGGGAQAGNQSAQAAADSALRAENERLKKERAKLQRESEDRVKKAEKAARRAGDRAITAEMRAEARLAGLVDPDYAVHLLAKAALKDENIDPSKFFAGLKSTHPHLFTVPVEPPAPPVAVAASSAPPESPAAGEVRPSPAAAGAPPAAVDAETMSDADFRAHQRNYGFTGV